MSTFDKPLRPVPSFAQHRLRLRPSYHDASTPTCNCNATPVEVMRSATNVVASRDAAFVPADVACFLENARRLDAFRRAVASPLLKMRPRYSPLWPIEKKDQSLPVTCATPDHHGSPWTSMRSTPHVT